MVNNLKLLKILLGKKKWNMFFVLVVALFAATLLECLGISLVFPVVSILLNPDFLTDSGIGIWFRRYFRVQDSSEFLKWMLCLIGLCYLLKNMYLLGVNYLKNHFILQCQFELKKKILFGFFYAPYIKYLDYSTAELVQAVETDVDGCIILMEKMLSICGELLMIVLLSGLMFSMNPEITIVVFLLCGGIFFAFSYFFKPYFERQSMEYAAARKDFTKWLYQSVGNRKEIKAEQKEYFFLKNFDLFSERACRIDTRVRFLQGLPKPVFECSFVFCIICSLLFLAKNQENAAAAAAQLSLFGIIVIRILPSLLKLNQLLGSTFWNTPMLKRTSARLQEQEEFEASVGQMEIIPFKKELVLEKIRFIYPGAEVPVFDGASMEIKAGEITGLSGLSGAGKTTLVDIIAGLLPVSDGEIRIDGVLLRKKENFAAWQAGVAYIPQNACLLNGTIRENILFGSKDQGDEAIWEVLQMAAADTFVRALPDALETVTGENGCKLSGGQAQRLVLARALYKKARLLILDETTSALDQDTEELVLHAMKRIRHFCTVILISHRASTLAVCDVVYRIQNGKIEKEMLKKK